MKNGQTPQDQIMRAQLLNDLRQTYEQSLDERITRFLEINHQGIIGDHYFSAASSECILLYRDGHFISAVMASQAVNEGIVKFIADRNNIPREKHDKLIETLKNKGMISGEFAAASTGIWNSHRNDVHHMNPKVSKIPFQKLAKKNLKSLAIIENEIFGVACKEGKLFPKQPKYWEIQKDGTVPVYLRLNI